MWKCPKCKRLFVQRNLSHSCIKTSVRQFLKGKPRRGVDLYRNFLNEYRKIGPVILHPVKTRLAFMVKVRFCAIYKITDSYVSGTLWLKGKYPSKKFYKIEHLTKNDYIHYFRIFRISDIDQEFRRYMKLSYAVGKRA